MGTNSHNLRHGALSPEQATALRKRISQNPDDVEAHVRLALYHERKQGQSKSHKAAFVKHLLWIIERYPSNPDLKLLVWHSAEDDNFNQVKNQWLAAIDSHPESTTVLNNAAHWCVLWDRSTSEKLWEKACILEPLNAEWHRQLSL